MQYLSNADLSTVNLSFYCFVSANCLPVYHRPGYRLPVFLFLCICQLSICLPPTCPPMFTDYRLPVYRLPVFLFLCICQLPTCLPPTCPNMSTHYLSTPDLSTATCLPIPMHLPTAYLSTADLPTYVHRLPVYCGLSTTDMYSSYLLYAMSRPVNRRPVYRLPVFLFFSICQLPTCLPPICPPMSTDYLSAAYLSTADLPTNAH